MANFDIMRGGPSFDPDGHRSAAERAMEKAREIMRVNHLDERSFPWTDPMFQGAVCHLLREAGKWEADARKLAVVKEVFGGAR